ncbi:hypothetical protein HAHE_01280 [Haloferula helveola]|uniref:PAS domain-containing sensor histidine kinase n=1 Tax=Haloferula helveola TaxID=490095 RepID=A0ABM7R9Q6_9BACT|nr:hypothetical protein HAHE_01280 [Haloferula helveola]
MMRTRYLVSVLAVVLGVGILMQLFRRQEVSAPEANRSAEAKAGQPSGESESDGPSGMDFLDGYSDAGSTPAEDMRKLGRAVEGMLLLFKGLDTRLIATNRQLSDFITGANPERLAYLDRSHPVFDGEGRMADRWGSPIVIHPLGTGLLELRSAGPDRVAYTEDDLSLLPDGQLIAGYGSRLIGSESE